MFSNKKKLNKLKVKTSVRLNTIDYNIFLTYQ